MKHLTFFAKGGAPSPFDRNFGTKISAKAMQWVTKKLLETFRHGKAHDPPHWGTACGSSDPSLPPEA